MNEQQIRRYARHIVLKEIGGTGQERLLASRALVIGAGGLGSPALLYLAAAGIGTLGIVDDDRVELSNLQRQVLHTTARVGQPKTASAAEGLAALDPDIRVVRHDLRLDAGNAAGLVRDYVIVLDGSDNFATRYAVNDACVAAGKVLVTAAILGFDGQLTTVRPGGPCYRCLYPEAPPPELAPSCTVAGVLGALAGTMGALQATEAVKELLGLGEGLSGRLLLYDALGVTTRVVRYGRRADCPAHG